MTMLESTENTKKENKGELDYGVLHNCICNKKYGYIYYSVMIDNMEKDLKAAQIYKPKENTTDYISVTGTYNYKKDCFYYDVQDGNRAIDLYSGKIENYLVGARDAKECLKLFDWVNDDGIRKLETSSNFIMKDLYSYIMQKATNDEDFLTWWTEYNFSIGLYTYDNKKGWDNTKQIKGRIIEELK